MREPRPHRAGALRRRGGRRAARRGQRPAASTPTPSRRCSAPPAIACARRREGPAGLTPREVEVLRLLARGLSNKADRRAARDLAEDRRQPHRAHLREDRRLEPRAREPVRDAARPPARRRSSRPLRRLSAVPASPACSSSSSPRRPCSSSLGLNCTNSLPASAERDVAGRQVERVAGLEDLLVVGEAEGQPALEHVAPVRALAAVVRQALRAAASRRCPARNDTKLTV